MSSTNDSCASTTSFINHESDVYADTHASSVPCDIANHVYHSGFISKSVGWMFLAVFIVIAGLAISNRYAINHINHKLNRAGDNVMHLELDMRHLIRQLDNRVEQQSRELKTEFEQLTSKYDQIADQERDVLILFKRLSDQYNIMSQQLREIKSAPDGRD